MKTDKPIDHKHPLYRAARAKHLSLGQLAVLLGFDRTSFYDIVANKSVLPSTKQRLFDKGIEIPNAVYDSGGASQFDKAAYQHNMDHPIRIGGWISYPDGRRIKDDEHQRWTRD